MPGQAGLNLIITAKTSRQQVGSKGGNMLKRGAIDRDGRTAGNTEPAVRGIARRSCCFSWVVWHTRG